MSILVDQITFFMKENDLLPTLDATLNDINGPVDLQGATVEFHMQAKGGQIGGIVPPLKVSAAATSLQVGDGSDGSKGKVRYSWTGTDTDGAGEYRAEFEITKSGKQLTFPNTGYIYVVIYADLNSEAN